ncbi:mucin-17-like [Gigantopelta aegis]|uniref:mucin-17-like n=1 Tax=Gigantopelta aegis TaxID=1735272 RepID=UPI001B88764D|nr:mucin-17-like [Gigantopelta aegis]
MDEDSFFDALTGDENSHVTIASSATVQNIKRTPLSPNPTNILNNMNKTKLLKLNTPDTIMKKEIEFTSPSSKKKQSKKIVVNHTSCPVNLPSEVDIPKVASSPPRPARVIQNIRHSSSDQEESGILTEESMLETTSSAFVTGGVADESLLSQFGRLSLEAKTGISLDNNDGDDDDVISFKGVIEEPRVEHQLPEVNTQPEINDNNNDVNIAPVDLCPEAVSEKVTESSLPCCPVMEDNSGTEHIHLADVVTEKSHNSNPNICDSLASTVNDVHNTGEVTNDAQNNLTEIKKCESTGLVEHCEDDHLQSVGPDPETDQISVPESASETDNRIHVDHSSTETESSTSGRQSEEVGEKEVLGEDVNGEDRKSAVSVHTSVKPETENCDISLSKETEFGNVTLEVDTGKAMSNIDLHNPCKPESQQTNVLDGLQAERILDDANPDSSSNCEPSKSNFTDSSLDDIDPFQTKSAVKNSPLKLNTTDSNSVDGAAVTLEDITPVNQDTYMSESPGKSMASCLNNGEPLTMETEIKQINALDKAEATESEKPIAKSDVTPCPDNTDPCQTDCNMNNSPAKIEPHVAVESMDEINPFITKIQLANSPVPVQNCDDIGHSKTKNTNTNSEQPQDETCLFDSGRLICNSMSTKLDDISTLDATPELNNSPVTSEAMTTTEDNTASKLDIMAATSDDIDPFKTKTQLKSSPVKSEMVTTKDETTQLKTSLVKFEASTDSQNQNTTCTLSPMKSNTLVTGFDDIDPFKTKTQLKCSPVKPEMVTDDQDNISSVDSGEQLANLPMISAMDNIDPFKTKTQLKSSPVKSEMMTTTEDETTQLKTSLVELETTTDSQNQNTTCTLSPMKSNTLVTGFDDIDPFKTKTQLKCSPVKPEMVTDDQDNISSVDSGEQLANLPMISALDNIDPFKTKTQLKSSPVKSEMMTTTEDETTQLKTSLVELETTTDSQNQNTMCTLSPMKSNTLVTAFDDIDPFKTKTQLKCSPVNSEMVPDDQDGMTSVDSYGQLANSAISSDNIDPFKTKTMLQSSPVNTNKVEKTLDVHTPSKLDVVTSGFDDMDPLKSKTQLKSSPVNSMTATEALDKTDSYDPSAQLTSAATTSDAMATCLGDIDPFKTNSQPKSSPVKLEVVMESQNESVSLNSQLVNTPTKSDDIPSGLDDIDPFKTNTKLKTSPVHQGAQLKNSPSKSDIITTSFEDVDPFKPKSMLKSSPLKSEMVAESLKESVSLNSSSQLAKSDEMITDFDDIDPFKSKTELKSSPVKSEMTKESLDAAAGTLDDINPFTSKTQLTNSFVKSEIVRENSPLKSPFDDIDPFKTNICLKNYPGKQEYVKPSLSDAGLECCEDIDPFKAKSKIPNSPVQSDVTALEENGIASPKTNNPKTITPAQDQKSDSTDLSSHGGLDLLKQDTQTELPSLTSETPALELDINSSSKTQGLDNELPVTSKDEVFVSDVAVPEQATCAASAKDNFLDEDLENPIGIKDDEFIPGEQIFSNPAAWDLLEQFGNNSNSSTSELSRISLYRKFDPLVTSRPELPQSPVAVKPNTSNTSVLEHTRLDNIDESLCLLGTPPKVSRRRSILHRRPPTSVSQPITEEPTVPMVDIIFSLNPEDSDKEVCPENPNEIIEVLQYTEADWRKLQGELKLGFEGIMLSKEKAWSKKYKAAQMEIAEEKKCVEKARQSEREMCIVVREYEKTVESLIACNEKLKQKEKSTQQQLDQSREDVASVEKAFSDLHRRYEKMKEVLTGFRQNEETLKTSMQKNLEKWKQKDEDFMKFKKEAEEKLLTATKNFNALKKSSEAESFKLKTTLKKKDLELDSTNAALEQKTKDVKELIELCDTLMARVEGQSTS